MNLESSTPTKHELRYITACVKEESTRQIIKENLKSYNKDTHSQPLWDYVIDKSYKTTPLVLAAELNNAIMVKFLIENRTNVDVQDNNGYTALMYACLNNNDSLFTYLLKNKATTGLGDKDDYTVLLLACTYNRFSILQYLLNKNNACYKESNILAKTRFQETALMLAASAGHNSICELLLSENVIDINAVDVMGQTALVKAILSGNRKVTYTLLKSRAHVDIPDNDGNTALFHASIWKYEDIVVWLIGLGAMINHKNTEGQTIHDITLQYGVDNIQAVIDKARKTPRLTFTNNEYDKIFKSFDDSDLQDIDMC